MNNNILEAFNKANKTKKSGIKLLIIGAIGIGIFVIFNKITLLGFFMIFGIIIEFVGLMVLLMHYRSIKIIKKIRDRYTDSDLDKISAEINRPNTKSFEYLKLYLTDNYVICLNEICPVIIPYQEIICVYPFESRQYRQSTQRGLHIRDINNQTYVVGSAIIHGRSLSIPKEISKHILSKNSDILYGDTKKNKQIIEQRFK